MNCPICQSETKVIDVRNTSKWVRRRRECVSCLTRFSTHEQLIMQSMDKHLQDKYLTRIGG